jgi:hypothetical protein
MSPDVIAIIEAIYRIESEPEAWLTDIVRAALPLMDEGFGLSAGMYDAAGPSLAVEAFVSVGTPPGSSEKIAATAYDFTPEFVDAGFLGHVCETASRVAGWRDLAFVREGTLVPSEFAIGSESTGSAPIAQARSSASICRSSAD